MATLRNVMDPRINRSSVDGTVRSDTHTKHYASLRFWWGHKLIKHSRISLQLSVWSPQKCGILSVPNLNKNIYWKNINLWFLPWNRSFVISCVDVITPYCERITCLNIQEWLLPTLTTLSLRQINISLGHICMFPFPPNKNNTRFSGEWKCPALTYNILLLTVAFAASSERENWVNCGNVHQM